MPLSLQMKSSTSTGQFQLAGTVSTPQIHNMPILSHLVYLFHLYSPVSCCSGTEKTLMKAYNYSQLQLKMQVKRLSAFRIYVFGHPWCATLDTLPSQLHMTLLCHRCKPVLHSPQPLTFSIPNLLSEWVNLSSHCLSIMHHIRSTPVSLSRPSQPSNEEGHCYGQRCVAYVSPSTTFV